MFVPRSLDGFDVTAAVGRMLDQPMLWWRAIGLFVEHFSGWEQTWQDSIGDDAREQKRVHALRGAAANIGAMTLSEAAAVLENQLLKRQAGDTTSVPDHLRQQLLDSFRQTWLVAAEAWKSSASDLGEQLP